MLISASHSLPLSLSPHLPHRLASSTVILTQVRACGERRGVPWPATYLVVFAEEGQLPCPHARPPPCARPHWPALASQASPHCAHALHIATLLTLRRLPSQNTGNLLKVTEGEHAGKLCLLDFGLVAEVPAPDREAMVSATIHLANRDWPALIDDFVALDFLPANCDRGVIIPVMDRVLSPYLRGGGAKSFNFQVRAGLGMPCVSGGVGRGVEGPSTGVDRVRTAAYLSSCPVF